MINSNYTTIPNVGNRRINPYTQMEINPEAMYGDHIADTTAICNSACSHVCGNILSVVEKYLLDTFPQDLFKTVTASSTIASRQLTHLPHQLIKKEMPIMVLVPRVIFGQEENRFLGNTLFNSRRTDTFSYWGDGSLIPLASDKKNRLYLHGHYNRMVMFVDVVLSFNTLNEQINYMSYIHNMIPVGHNKFIRAPLELYIPDELCSLISNFVKIPIIDESGSVINFLSYMNTIFGHPITYKLKGGSNSNEFFMYYISDIDTVVQDVNMVEGIKDGHIKRNFNITFSVRTEFNTIGYFTLNHPNARKSYINTREDKKVLSIFTDEINIEDFKLPQGWVALGWPIFRLQNKENSISFDSVLNESIRAVIDYNLQAGIPLNTFINIQFREQGRILPNELFTIDWVNRTITVLNPNYHRTYRLIITVSPEYINNTIKQVYNLE